MTKKTVFAALGRVLFLLVGAGVIAVAYGLVQIALAPVPVPPVPPSPASVSFDPKLDVTKNDAFARLRPEGPPTIETGLLGRQNPFIPPPTATAVEVPPTATPTPTTTRVNLTGTETTTTPPLIYATSTH